MTSADIDIILKSDDYINVQIHLAGEETWKKEYPKETRLEKMFEDYASEATKEFPNEIKNILKAQREKDVTIEEEPLINYVNGYEEENSAFSKIRDLDIPEIIGKPFSNPFSVFTYIKKEKTLKLLKFGNNNLLSELDDYNSSSAYCNGNNKVFISGGEKGKGEYAEKFWIIDLKTAEIESNDMIPKKNHSMIIIPGNYIFIVGGQTKQTFYFDIENSKFHGWKKLNKQRIEPALIVVDDYLYCFDNMNSNMGEKFTFEKTNLNSSEHIWELLEPNMPSIRMNQKYFGVTRNQNDIIFIGGNLDLEEKDNISERKSFKYNIENNSIEESETNYIDYNFKEKTFLKYNEKISYILPDFNRYHPEVMFYQKEKNAIKFLKCYSKKKLEEKEREKDEKNIRDFSPIKMQIKFNLNQPKEANFNDDNINTKLAKDFNKDEEIKLINENSENKNEYEENKNEYEENKNEYEEKKNEEQNNYEYDPNNIDNSNNYGNENNKDFNNEQNYGSNEFEVPEKEKHSEQYEQNKENEQNENGEQNVEQKEEQNIEQNVEQKEEQDVEQNVEQNEVQKDMNEEKESNALNNDVNTNNVEILEDMLKSSQHKPEQNIEINVEGNLMQNQDINLRGQVNNINPEVKVPDTNNLGLTGNLGIETSVINPINDPKISMNLPQPNIDLNNAVDLKGPNLNIPQTNIVNPQIDVNVPNVNIDNIGLGINNTNLGTNINVGQIPGDDNQVEFCITGVIVGTNDDKAKYAKYNLGGNTNFGANLNIPSTTMPNMNANLNVPNMNMPNVDTNISMPNVNLPNVDTNINMPNVNMPDMNANLNVPSVNMPNVDTKLNAPNINMPNIDTNLNVPNVNMPNIDTKLNVPNIGLPQVDANLNLGIQENENGEFCITGIIVGKNETNPAILKANTQMNIGSNLGQLPNPSGIGINTELNNPLNTGLSTNINGLGTGVNMPEGGIKLDGNINIPSLNPEINMNTNLPNLNTSNQIGVSVPNLNNNLPNINVTNPTVELPSTNLDVNGAVPNINTNISNINTNIQSNLPGINTNLHVPNVNTTGMGINMNSDNENGFFSLNGVIQGSKDVNINTGNLNIPSGGVNINMNQNMPGININGPNLDINGTATGTNLNNQNMALGRDVNINNPNLNIQSPELTNTLNINSNIQINDNINMPKINITDPKVGGNFNGDIKASVPQDMNINVNPINVSNQNNNIGLNANIGTSNVGGFGISIGQK